METSSQLNGLKTLLVKSNTPSHKSCDTLLHRTTPEKLSDGQDVDHQESNKDEGNSDQQLSHEELRGLISSKENSKESQLLEKKPAIPTKDANLVTWDSANDPQNPKNWSMKRKWAALTIVAFFTIVSPITSSMIAPALSHITADFRIKNEVQSQLTLSIFVLAQAIGPLCLGPLSEIYGRTIVLQLSNLFFVVWNLGCGFSQTPAQLMVCRFFSGLGGSGPLAIGGGILSDCFLPEQRGRAVSIYSLGPLLGPAVGPILGGFISQNTSWRWYFHATTIFAAMVQFCGFFFLQETYAPRLLQLKRDKLRKETGNQELRTTFDTPDRTVVTIIKTALKRPFKLLGTQPIVQVLACYMAYLFGLMYLMLSTFPILWVDRYGMSISTGSLNYLSIGIGFFVGTQITSLLIDALYCRLKFRNNGIVRPEFRVPMLVPASLVIPAGLFWYGWSAQVRMHWIVPNAGAAIFSAGMVMAFQCINGYLIDSYTRYAASAIAAATVLRSLAGFGFPLFAPAIYKWLDFGWGNSVLGFIAIGLGVPAPFMLWRFGEKLRSLSRFAAG
ncbi:major facilitator superfamily domain-containing protein [Bipolaris maydis]|nr:major facilitator superfamily domain-containing protein [Bipolaris maydis]KAJ6207939.1 major facilitator superfamily domain-containing protein [Bipolaris maydis]KAJ6269435.1 major facilitator superfamily domain-containing protein [Bipolaris maydis]